MNAHWSVPFFQFLHFTHMFDGTELHFRIFLARLARFTCARSFESLLRLLQQHYSTYNAGKVL